MILVISTMFGAKSFTRIIKPMIRINDYCFILMQLDMSEQISCKSSNLQKKNKNTQSAMTKHSFETIRYHSIFMLFKRICYR